MKSMKAGAKGAGKVTKAQMKRVLRKLVKDAFSLWAETGRLRAGDRCEKCGAERGSVNGRGSKVVLDGHHVVIREVKSVRFDPNNCCVLCQNCHKFGKEGAHRGTIVFSDWFRLARTRDYFYILKERLGRDVESFEDVSLATAQLRSLKWALFAGIAGA